MNLRERVEHGAGRLAHEMQRTPHVERAVQRVLGSLQIADPDADLAERGKRHAEAVRRAGLLLEVDASFGERQRLLVPMLHQRDVRLVPAHGRQHVARFDHDGQTLGLAERRDRFVEPPFLRERHARQANAPSRGGVDRRRRAGQRRPW